MNLLSRTEELILLAVFRLKADAYCVPIRRQISEVTGEDWSLGSIYMPLDRLVKKGYLDSYLSASTPERGGRHKRIYKLTPTGRGVLENIREVQSRMWHAMPESLKETK